MRATLIQHVVPTAFYVLCPLNTPCMLDAVKATKRVGLEATAPPMGSTADIRY